MKYVAVAAVDLLAAGSHGYLALLRIIEAIFTRLQIPFAPGRNDLQMRSQRLVCMFKAHLVVAFSSTAVGNGGGSFAQRNLHLMFGDDWTRQRSAQQVLMLVHGPCHDGGEDVAGEELLAHIFHDDLGSAV